MEKQINTQPIITTDLKVGQIITAYGKGIHRITKIERRFYKNERDIPSFYKSSKIGDEYSPLVHYELLMYDTGKKVTKNKVSCCDALYCLPVEQYVKQEEERLNNIKNLVNEYTV